MSSRPRHPNKHIEAAVQYAESRGWRCVISGGHAWGKLFCLLTDREGCQFSVWSTPRNPESHARYICREVDRCPHFLDPPVTELSPKLPRSGNVTKRKKK